MEITVSEMRRVTLVEVNGRVDSNSATRFGETISEQIDAGRHQIVIDLAQVDYMSSAGLRELVSSLKTLHNLNGDLRIASPSPKVKEVFIIAGLDAIFKMFPTQVEAVGSF